jgi:hypothetical protein
LGNGASVLIGATYAERAGFLKDGRSVTNERGGGLGGETTRPAFRLRSMEIAGKVFRNVAATIDAQPSATDANVGVAILRNFLISTDFADHSLWLAPQLE